MMCLPKKRKRIPSYNDVSIFMRIIENWFVVEDGR